MGGHGFVPLFCLFSIYGSGTKPSTYHTKNSKKKVLKHRTTTRGVHLTTTSESTDDNIVAALKHEIRNLKEQHKNEVAALKQELEEANERIERLTAELIRLG